MLLHLYFTADRRNRYRTLQLMDFTADGRDRYRTLQLIDTTADGCDRYRLNSSSALQLPFFILVLNV